jgi:hypothetical protein
LIAVAAVSSAALVGCSSQTFPPSPVNAILTDREAARLAELHLNQTDPQANPRDVVSIEPTGDGNLVSFNTFFDETAHPAEAVADRDGGTRRDDAGSNLLGLICRFGCAELFGTVEPTQAPPSRVPRTAAAA